MARVESQQGFAARGGGHQEQTAAGAGDDSGSLGDDPPLWGEGILRPLFIAEPGQAGSGDEPERPIGVLVGALDRGPDMGHFGRGLPQGRREPGGALGGANPDRAPWFGDHRRDRPRENSFAVQRGDGVAQHVVQAVGILQPEGTGGAGPSADQSQVAAIEDIPAPAIEPGEHFGLVRNPGSHHIERSIVAQVGRLGVLQPQRGKLVLRPGGGVRAGPCGAIRAQDPEASLAAGGTQGAQLAEAGVALADDDALSARVEVILADRFALPEQDVPVADGQNGEREDRMRDPFPVGILHQASGLVVHHQRIRADGREPLPQCRRGGQAQHAVAVENRKAADASVADPYAAVRCDGDLSGVGFGHSIGDIPETPGVQTFRGQRCGAESQRSSHAGATEPSEAHGKRVRHSPRLPLSAETGPAICRGARRGPGSSTRPAAS